MADEVVKVVSCECGWEVRGTDDEIVRAVREHGRTAHQMDVSAEQALAMAKPVVGES
jgi:predicted small metal-binding protein